MKAGLAWMINPFSAISWNEARLDLPSQQTSRFRFAPSPNGRLHLGHAFSALLNQRLAREAGGVFLVRIEDIDRPRCPPSLGEAALADLAWLGITSDEPVRWQSRHGPDHAKALETLKDKGLVYPCRCSRGDVAKALAMFRQQSDTGLDGLDPHSEPTGISQWFRDPDGAPLYPGTCRTGIESHDETVAWRLDMAAALRLVITPLTYMHGCEDGIVRSSTASPLRWGDVVLARRDIGTSYHLSVVVDDAVQGITHVVRGTDLEAATDIHVLLQHLLGLPTPVYRFHGLISDRQGLKLAKSRGSRSLHDLRMAGATAPEIRKFLGF